MPDVLPTINNEPPQGIQALLDTVYLWNPDVANDLIEKINVLLGTLENSGKIRPYSEIEAPVRQYMPCYDGDNVYVAAQELDELPAELDPTQWILIATKAPILQGGTGIEINGNEISVTSEISSGAAAGSTAVQPGDLGTAAYAASSDFATAVQGDKADTAIQPGDLATVATTGAYSDLTGTPTIPAAQVNSDWTATSGVAEILHKPTLGTAAAEDTTAFATAAQGTLADTALQASDIVDNLNSTSATKALSANQGRELESQIVALEGRGHYLSSWNCATGLAATNPPSSPYVYKAGDYFIVGTVDTTTNYRPSGSQYVIGTASSIVETEEVAVNDTYTYDGTNWSLLKTSKVDALPPQTGNAGKVLTTDGTNAAWSSTVSPLEIRTTDTSVHGQSTKLTFSTAVEGSTTKPIVMASSGSGQLIITAPNGVVFDGSTLMPRINANSRLGFDLLKWESIFVTRINNGEYISVPTVGGSMAVQVSSMPTAAATLVGQIYQFVGTTDQNYTNGYFYKCVSDGQDPATYSWSQLNVQSSGNYLPLSGGMMTGPINFEGAGAYAMSVKASATNTTGLEFSSTYGSGMNPIIMDFGNNTIMNQADNTGSLGQPSYRWGRVCTTALNNGNAIDVPTVAGKMAVQVSSMPTASYALEGQIYQFIGTTDSTYTNGYFYKCVSDISDPETYSWAAVSVQAGGSGSVPTLTWYTVSTAGNTLTIADTSSAQLVKVYKNGLLLQPTEDYTISGTTLTTVGALVVGDKITTEVL